jgi:hypothetical protein
MEGGTMTKKRLGSERTREALWASIRPDPGGLLLVTLPEDHLAAHEREIAAEALEAAIKCLRAEERRMHRDDRLIMPDDAVRVIRSLASARRKAAR